MAHKLRIPAARCPACGSVTRDFALVGFGGAGPMHGFLVAEDPGHVPAVGGPEGALMSFVDRDLSHISLLV